MDISHLHLHVRDRTRSRVFYERWFGLAVEFEEESITFMRGDRAFLLALVTDASPASMPPWFHFGFRLESGTAVQDLHDRLQAAGVSIVRPLSREKDFASFRCADPDGYVIENFWSAT